MAPIIPRITSALRTFSGRPLGIMSKALGAAAVASVVYDSHVNGRERANVTDEIESADRFINQYEQYVTSDKQSATVCGLKKKWFDIQQGFSYYHPVSRAKGYLSGFGNTVISELPVIALSVLALGCKNAVSKGAGVLLALHGLKTLFYDVMGIGKKSS